MNTRRWRDFISRQRDHRPEKTCGRQLLVLAKRILEDLDFSGSEGELTDRRSNSLQTSLMPWIALFDGPLQPFPLSEGSYEQFNLSSSNRSRHWRNCRRFSWMHASNYSSTGRYRHYVGGTNNDGRKRHQPNIRARHHRSNPLGDRRERDWFEPRWCDGLGSGRYRRQQEHPAGRQK